MALAVIASACSNASGSSDTTINTRNVMSAVVEPWGSIEDLTAHSDLVILGTVGDIIARENDRGGDPPVDPDSGEPIPGIPMAFATVTVDQVLDGRDPGKQIAVGFIDESQVVSEDSSPLAAGDHVLLFLEHRDSTSAPGITVLKEHWVPVSGDNGVLDVEPMSGTVVARSTLLVSLVAPTGAGQKVSKEPLQSSLEAIEAAIADATKE